MTTLPPTINHYVTILKTYNEKVNVYSKPAYDKLDFHIQDCITLAQHIGNKRAHVLDMGSGSGLPSIIIAIMNPKNSVTAVESKSKKCRFLNHVADELDLKNITIVNQNIHEFIHHQQPKPDFITAKAFASYEKIHDIVAKINHHPSTLILPISGQQVADLPNRQFSDRTILHEENTPYYYLKESIL